MRHKLSVSSTDTAHTRSNAAGRAAHTGRAGDQALTQEARASLAALRQYRGTLPEGFKFDRAAANERG